MKVLIIEPHGDDALISCSRILRADIKKDIFTLASRSSERLQDHFESVQSVEFVDSEDYHWKNRPVDHRQVTRWYKEGLNPFNEYMNLLTFQDGFIEKVDFVSTRLKELIKSYDYDLVIAPLGVVHPYHCVVRSAIDVLIIEDDLHEDKVVYYSEGPYNAKKYGKLLENGAIEALGDRGLNVTFPSDTTWWEDKEGIYRKVYPTEVSLFRFSYDEVIQNMENYVGSFNALKRLKEVIA